MMPVSSQRYNLSIESLLKDLEIRVDPTKAFIAVGLGSYINHCCAYHSNCFPGPEPVIDDPKFPNYIVNATRDYMNGQVTALTDVRTGEALSYSYSDDCPYRCTFCTLARYPVKKVVRLGRVEVSLIVNSSTIQVQHNVCVNRCTLEGYGLFATTNIPDNTVIRNYSGEVRLVEDVETDPCKSYFVPLYPESHRYIDGSKVLELPEVFLFDKDARMSIAGVYANSCTINEGKLVPEVNAKLQPIVVQGKLKIFLVAAREIYCCEEIVLDYHWLMNEDCLCEYPTCKQATRRSIVDE